MANGMFQYRPTWHNVTDAIKEKRRLNEQQRQFDIAQNLQKERLDAQKAQWQQTFDESKEQYQKDFDYRAMMDDRMQVIREEDASMRKKRFDQAQAKQKAMTGLRQEIGARYLKAGELEEETRKLRADPPLLYNLPQAARGLLRKNLFGWLPEEYSYKDRDEYARGESGIEEFESTRPKYFETYGDIIPFEAVEATIAERPDAGGIDPFIDSVLRQAMMNNNTYNLGE